MKCEICGIEHDGKFGSGRFCSRSCSNKRVFTREQNQLKGRSGIENSNFKGGRYRFNCKVCGKAIRKNEHLMCRSCWIKSEEFHIKMTDFNKKKASSIEEKIRLRNIGRKGGFGKKGYTKSGVYFQSSIEEKCFNFLDEHCEKYSPHKPIPNSAKISDIYLDNFDIWIEIDGINREANKKWLGKDYEYWLEKLNIYKLQDLKFYIVFSYEEFVQLYSSLT